MLRGIGWGLSSTLFIAQGFANPHRNLAPEMCTAKVYNQGSAEPTEIKDTIGCNGGSYQRVFLRDVISNSTREKPLLRANQRFVCPQRGNCVISFSGYGLQKGDYAALTEGQKCGDKIFEAFRVQNITAMELQVGDNRAEIVNVLRSTGVLQFDSNLLKSDKLYRICYASQMGFKESESPASEKDYLYNIGTVKKSNNEIYHCDFEGGSLSSCGLAVYRPRQDVDLEWKIMQGNSTTPGSGPSADHTSGGQDGHYAIMKSPGYMQDAASATIIGPALFTAGSQHCLLFAFNMHGEDVNALRVYLVPSLTTDSFRNIPSELPVYSEHSWGVPRWVGVGNKGVDWHIGGIQIPADTPGPVHPVFEALTGKSEKGDIALDDIKVVSGQCPVEARSHPRSYVGQDNMICGEVRMITGNHPDDKSWSLEGAISCSGRGYSASQVSGAWMPCCVPNFGSYTMLLRDAMNDGWEGSKLEIRFFDKTYTFGDEMKHRTGEVKIPITIGQLDILKATYKENQIDISVRVTYPNSYIWCGLTEAMPDGSVRTPPPHLQLLKDYGVRSSDATTESGQVQELSIKGEFIKSHHIYDVYCYSETSDSADDVAKMGDDQILGTRYRITADIDPPEITVKEVTTEGNKAVITLKSSEKSKVWCLASLLPAKLPVTKDMVQLKGDYIEFSQPEEQQLEIHSLASESVYKLHCYAEDFTKPYPNFTSDEIIEEGVKFTDRASEVKFTIGKRYPNVTIKQVATITNGFDVLVGLDGSGAVHCAAAPEGVEFPSVQEVIDAGAFATLSKSEFAQEGTRDVKVAIRGVKTKTPYKIFCTPSSLDGSMKGGDKEMWKTAVPAVSYGRFCEIPASPPVGQKDEKPTPFDPLTSDEELNVRKFMLSQKDLHLSAVYRVNLFHNKCVDGRGFYEQLKVGPLEGGDDMIVEPLSMPVETTCGGYNAEGIFGRRLTSVDSFETGFQDLLRYSFGSPFEVAECSHATDCLRLGAIAVDTPKADKSHRQLVAENASIWVGLKLANGQPIPLYFNIDSRKLGIEGEFDPAGIAKLLDLYDWPSHDGPIWYDGQLFQTIADLVQSWRDKTLKTVTLDNLDKRRRTLPSSHKRRLAPSPYAGAAGTAGMDLDRLRKRTGLEYRIPPEHIEPGGKRYTIKSHPGGQSYTIEYAGWSFTVTNDRDKSMQIWNVIFQGERIIFQLGLQEAMAHYTVSERTFFFMDSWYGGLGGAARPVLRGYECPKHGVLVFYDQSLCVWEQDMARPIRSHYRSGEIRDAAGHYALHIRQMLTVSNYDYVTTYIFHPSGHIEAKVEFTGELYAGVEVPWWSQRQAHYGTLVTGAMRLAALHAHLVVWKIDFDLEDYKDNSVWFEHVIPDPKRVGANYIDRFFPDGELAGAIGVNDTRNVAYEIISENRNTYGNYGGWRILPGHSWSPNQPHAELYAGTGSWAKYKVLSTQFKYGELDATLPRDNKFAGDPAVSIDRYIGDNEPLRHTDIVTWSSMSFMHIPSAEDYPLTIPIGNTLSMMLRPNNWFLEDPSMDLHNAIGGDFKDPGQCAVVRKSIFDAMDTKKAKGPILV